MSYDLEIATVQKPEEAQVRAAVAREPNLNVEGHLGIETNLVVQMEKPGGPLPLFTIDGPKPVGADERSEPPASRLPGARWMLDISVPEAGRPRGVQLAMQLALSLAATSGGVVYDPQTDELLWPDGGREQAESPHPEAVSVVNVVWIFPLSQLTEQSVQELLDMVRSVAPRALPRSTKKLLAVAEQASKGFSTVHWQGRPPFFDGSIWVSWNERGGVKGIVPAWKVALSLDAQALQSDRDLRKAVVDLFVRVATEMGAIYGAAYVERGYFWDGKELLSDFGTERALIPVWAGLPAFPTWLAWFGSPYMKEVEESLLGASTDRFPNGILLRTSDEPAAPDQLAAGFPTLPAHLVQHSRLEVHTERLRGGTTSRRQQAVHNVAHVIPPIE